MTEKQFDEGMLAVLRMAESAETDEECAETDEMIHRFLAYAESQMLVNRG